jgi:hypothetical protein
MSALRQTFRGAEFPVLADCALERPVTETIADTGNSEQSHTHPPRLINVMGRYAARSRFTISRTVFLLNPSRWLISRYGWPPPTSFSTLGAKRSAFTLAGSPAKYHAALAGCRDARPYAFAQ